MSSKIELKNYFYLKLLSSVVCDRKTYEGLDLNCIACSSVKVKVEFSLGPERTGTDGRPLTLGTTTSSKYKHLPIEHGRAGIFDVGLILERKCL